MGRPNDGVAQAALDPALLADSIRREIHRAVIIRDLDRLEGARVLAERVTTAFPDDPLFLHYLGAALYRQSALAAPDEALDAARRAQIALERSAQIDPPPETYAMLSTVIGQQIGANPLRGMTLGPKASAAMDRAIELGPTNPRVWMLYGTSAIYTPKLFGGGTGRAIERLLRAVELFETDVPSGAAPAWGQAEVYAWLGIAYTSEGRFDDAQDALENALRIEPDFTWVSEVLIPQLAEARRGR